MPADNDLDSLDRWLSQPVWPMSPPEGAFERITKRARRRRLRTAVTAVASAAAVVAAVAVAVPLGLSSIGPSNPTGNVAAGGSTSASSGAQSVPGSATHNRTESPSASRIASPITPRAAGSASAPSSGPTGIESPGYLPANFVPSSVTWISPSTGYIIGQAGTPGTCGAAGNSDICTSMAVTHDSGQTWAGVAAPSTGAASGLTGVSGVRFLNPDDGWAYGPELWYTTDGSASVPTWTKTDTRGQIITDLETAGDQAFAIFATCPSDVTQADIDYQCTSTLKTSVAGSNTWADVSGVPAGMTPSSAHLAGAVLMLANSAAGFLVTPQNVLYSGPLDGGAWHKVGALPCSESAAYLNNGIDHPFLLAAAGVLSDGSVRLALTCADSHVPSSVDTLLWLSSDSGQTWKFQSKLSANGGNAASIGIPASITAVGNQSVILATSKGIYYVPLGGSSWQQATFDGTPPANGFSYVGMTTPTQGVAIGDPGGTEIWMTNNAGRSWQPAPIQP